MVSSFSGSSISSWAPLVVGLKVTLMRSLGATVPSLAMTFLLAVMGTRGPIRVLLRGRDCTACDAPLPCIHVLHGSAEEIHNSYAVNAAHPVRGLAPKRVDLSLVVLGRAIQVGFLRVRIFWP
ncbi:hypothetical protein D3C76_1127660 [compost metagenome]